MLLYMISILVLITFISRLIICFNSFGWFSRGFAGDSSVHIQIIKQLKQGWKNKRIDNYIIPNEMSYPILFHRFCSFFPTYILEKKSFTPNFITKTDSYLMAASYVKKGLGISVLDQISASSLNSSKFIWNLKEAPSCDVYLVIPKNISKLKEENA